MARFNWLSARKPTARPKKRPDRRRGKSEAALERSLRTPEGVPLKVHLASNGDRAGAVSIDLMIITLALVAIAIVFIWLGLKLDHGSWLLPLYILLFFVLRSFYFIIFELRWQGRTPGKRMLGLRVIDPRGRPLTAEAVIARNLMREVELFLPISLLIAGPGEGTAGSWISLLVVAWAGIFLFFPFFNRDRLRAGDLAGGTWVIRVPSAQLLPELVSESGKNPKENRSAYQFSEKQLAVYGIFELQTLETVLRSDDKKATRTKADIAQKIRSKTGWQPPAGLIMEPLPFLEAFYAQLRSDLERRMLLGERRENKHHSVEGKGEPKQPAQPNPQNR